MIGSRAERAAAELRERRVVAHLARVAVVLRAAEQAVELRAERLMAAVRRERKPDARVVIEVQAERRARARDDVAVDLCSTRPSPP